MQSAFVRGECLVALLLYNFPQTSSGNSENTLIEFFHSSPITRSLFSSSLAHTRLYFHYTFAKKTSDQTGTHHRRHVYSIREKKEREPVCDVY